jgi:deoxyuridine 5'-triphosphate nucleotidohydrolase
MTVKLKYTGAARPKLTRGTVGSVGFDLTVCTINNEEVGMFDAFVLDPHTTVTIGTGIALAMPMEWADEEPEVDDPLVVGTPIIVPRSSTGRCTLMLANTIGVIDPDYRGEIMLQVHNFGDRPQVITTGDRLAQVLFLPVLIPAFEVVEDFTITTARGAGGFGSTGV